MKSQTDSHIEKKRLLNPTDKIIVGLSGGADSVALLHYLVTSGYSVVACHMNHMLRGDESLRDESFCFEFAKKLGVPLESRRTDIKSLAKEKGVSEEEAGREARYAFFEEMRIIHNADKIATAHTLSDNAETVIFNLTRGAGLKGLCGIPPVRGNIVRPLLWSTREDVERYCKENGLSFVTDSTNLKDDYTRNKIRHNVMPTLLEINESFYQGILRTNDILTEEQNFLDNLSGDIYTALSKDGVLFVGKLKLQEKAIRRRVIAKFLSEHNQRADFFIVDKIENMLAQNKGKINVKGDVFVELREEKLFCYSNEEENADASFEIKEGETIIFQGDSYKARIIEKKNCAEAEKINKMLLYIDLDYDKIKGQAILRAKKEGDKLSCARRGGTKSLKKIFIEQKLSESEKKRQAVIADEDSVIGLVGYDADRRAAVSKDTKRILRIEKL